MQVVEKKADDNFVGIWKTFVEFEALLISKISSEKAAWIAVSHWIAHEADSMFSESNAKFLSVKAMLNNFVAETGWRIGDLEHDFGQIQTDHTNLFYDYKDYCNQNELKYRDITVQFTMEKLKNMLEGNSIYTNIEDIYDSLNKIKGKGLL